MVRGLLPSDKPLNRTVRYWQTILEQSGTSHGVQIDPVAFSDAGITQVPTLLLSEDNKPLLKVVGVTSCEWLIRQFKVGHRGNLGSRGNAYPISEPDLLEVFLQRLKQQDWQAVQAKTSQRLQSKVLSFGAKLPTSRQTSSKVLKISGHWRTPIIALDINDRQQQKAVIQWLQQYPDALVLVSNGSLQTLSNTVRSLASASYLHHASGVGSSLSTDRSTHIADTGKPESLASDYRRSITVFSN